MRITNPEINFQYKNKINSTKHMTALQIEQFLDIQLGVSGVLQIEQFFSGETLIFDNEEQKDLWAGYFGDLAAKQEHAEDAEDLHLLELIRQHNETNPGQHETITTWEVEKAIKALNKGKAPDLDSITAEHLQFAPMAWSSWNPLLPL